MATTRKKETVKELNKLLAGSEVLIFTDYRGLKVSELNSLRRQLRDKGVEYQITKNTLTTLAAKRAGRDGIDAMLDGPTAIAFVGQDIPGAAKVFQDFMRTNKVLQIRGGLAGKSLLSPEQVGDLTKILRKEEYIARLMGSINAPVSNLVGVLANTVRSVLNVLNARADQLKEQGGDVSEVASEVAGAPASDVTPEAALEVASDTAPAVETEVATETAPEVAPEVTSEAAPETASDVAPEVASDTTSDVASDAGPEATAGE